MRFIRKTVSPTSQFFKVELNLIGSYDYVRDRAFRSCILLELLDEGISPSFEITSFNTEMGMIFTCTPYIPIFVVCRVDRSSS